MSWTLTLAALTLVSGLTAPPTAAGDDPPTRHSSQASEDKPHQWRLAMNVSAPMTTTDPQHVAFGLGVVRTGIYRIRAQYQPSETTLLGAIHASVGARVLRTKALDVAFDLDFNQVWADRRLFRGTGWQLEGHDRRRLSLGTVSLLPRDHRYFNLIEGVEVGAGRMYIRRLVSARAGSQSLNPRQEPILVSSGPVGMLGVRLNRSLLWGLTGAANVRLIGAGRSRGGEVPFAHLTASWSVTRQVFVSGRYGHGEFGVTGNHATSSRAATYFQNGLGLTFRIAF
jgi:hypothetical protein